MNVAAFNPVQGSSPIILQADPIHDKNNLSCSTRPSLSPPYQYLRNPPKHSYSLDGCCASLPFAIEDIHDCINHPDPDEEPQEQSPTITQVFVHNSPKDVDSVPQPKEQGLDYSDIIRTVTDATNGEESESPTGSVKVVVFNFFFPNSSVHSSVS